MRKNNDVFDRLMAKPYMARFRPYYNRYKEMLLYAFFGGGTVLINVIVYSVLTEAFFLGDSCGQCGCLALCHTVCFFHKPHLGFCIPCQRCEGFLPAALELQFRAFYHVDD